MKLAQALILRADHQKRLAQLQERLLRNAKVQQGDKPAEDPALLMAEMEGISEALVELIQRINRTNSASELASGTMLSDALASREVLRMRNEVYRELAEAATVTQGRYSRSEIKFESTVEVAEIQDLADRLAVEYRELDARIQEANWQLELME